MTTSNPVWKVEKSCGAVIFRQDAERGRLYLIEEMNRGHFSQCKGHVERNETEHETASREILEETGHKVRFVDGFRETIRYSPCPYVIKTVVFFLAECVGGEERAQPEEVRKIHWMPVKEALDALTYDGDRDILRKADAFLNTPLSDSFVRQASYILSSAIAAVLPYKKTKEALEELPRRMPAGRTLLVAIGKAAWEMASAANDVFGDAIDGGIVITKYGHSRGALPGLKILEAGHPYPDANTFRASAEVWKLTEHLTSGDRVLLLLSGGGSSLFELPGIEKAEYRRISEELVRSGAGIREINAVRKHLSLVKGGRFALHCMPASVEAVLLSDVLSDAPDVIASGPASPDPSTSAKAISVLEKYGISFSPAARACLETETPKRIDNANCRVIGSVRHLCAAAAEAAASLGYEPAVLTVDMDEEARVLARRLSSYADSPAARPKAYIAGGEPFVRVRGTGLGGRCQEMAVACAEEIRGKENCFFFAFGSDGTDGPTDAAGGYADGRTADRMEHDGIPPKIALEHNDTYHALEAVGQLIVTGPTGTNVNDLAVLLVKP